jgi:hypothetical protein
MWRRAPKCVAKDHGTVGDLGQQTEHGQGENDATPRPGADGEQERKIIEFGISSSK